ncbi:Lipid A 3-O-deacylase (PagL) [Loktanella fryxellensis]|uniref:Lipid A 3-O-deacylase (PagL) n=2 Tax=Loktanella fryxellensis TaxID=245187 RepID=A0A1H7Y7C4_9RHOB|nr:Lipid A 3-O-deacylase (PagL) [Loktanella fryxellensis]
MAISLADAGFGTASGTDRAPVTPRFSMQAGTVMFDGDHIGQELYLGVDSARRLGPVQPTYALSITTDGDVWVGAGAKWTSSAVLPGPLFFETSLMPGLYARGGGPDLGSVLEFRSAIGVGYTFDTDATLTVSYDHRSNGDIAHINPGLEVLSLRVAVPF